jgi:hypothetical protein
MRPPPAAGACVKGGDKNESRDSQFLTSIAGTRKLRCNPLTRWGLRPRGPILICRRHGRVLEPTLGAKTLYPRRPPRESLFDKSEVAPSARRPPALDPSLTTHNPAWGCMWKNGELLTNARPLRRDETSPQVAVAVGVSVRHSTQRGAINHSHGRPFRPPLQAQHSTRVQRHRGPQSPPSAQRKAAATRADAASPGCRPPSSLGPGRGRSAG